MVEIEAKLANLQSNSGDSKKDEILLRGFSFQVDYYLSPSLCVVPYYFSFVVIFPPHKLLSLQLTRTRVRHLLPITCCAPPFDRCALRAHLNYFPRHSFVHLSHCLSCQPACLSCNQSLPRAKPRFPRLIANPHLNEGSMPNGTSLWW